MVGDVPGDGGTVEVRTTLVVGDGTLRMERGEGSPEGPADGADVTIALDYAAAADLSRGELNPAEALAAGRVRVRGDLSVLTAAQEALAAAAPLLAPLREVTTYGPEPPATPGN